MLILILKFVTCILVVLFIGRKVALYGDVIAHRTRLGGVWIGLVLLALVTSLPEVFNGISSVVITGVPDLTIGNVLGANGYNLLTLAVLDIVLKRATIAGAASTSHRLMGWFSLTLIALAAIGIFVSLNCRVPALGWIGWYTPVIIAVYLYAVRRISIAESREKEPLKEPGRSPAYDSMPMHKIYLRFIGAAAPMIGAGIWLSFLGDELAQATGWGASFVGSLLIGFTTTLPEMTVSFSALRFGAIDLAVSNMVGSNLFNILIIALDDLLYFKGPVLSSIAASNLNTAIMVVLSTGVFLAAFYLKPQKRWRISWYNCLTVIIFLLSAYLNY